MIYELDLKLRLKTIINNEDKSIEYFYYLTQNRKVWGYGLELNLLNLIYFLKFVKSNKNKQNFYKEKYTFNWWNNDNKRNISLKLVKIENNKVKLITEKIFIDSFTENKLILIEFDYEKLIKQVYLLSKKLKRKLEKHPENFKVKEWQGMSYMHLIEVNLVDLPKLIDEELKYLI